jgi:hypothetical protein
VSGFCGIGAMDTETVKTERVRGINHAEGQSWQGASQLFWSASCFRQFDQPGSVIWNMQENLLPDSFC